MVRKAGVGQETGIGDNHQFSGASVPVIAKSFFVKVDRSDAAKANPEGESRMTFGPAGDECGDKCVWILIWVDNVAAVHQRCIDQGLDITWPPTNMPWGVRERHVRHPDGHVFRVSQGMGE